MPARLSYEYVKSVFEQGGCELLDKTYINAKSKLNYRCNCGNISTTYFSDFKKGHRCKACAYEKVAVALRLDISQVKHAFKTRGFELLTDTYVNSNTKMKYRCSCGNIAEITYDNFKSGQSCALCGIRAITGENHYKWNPELTEKERITRRQSTEYRDWRRKVFERDHYSCKCCGDKAGGNLQAHHIENYMENIQARYEISNGITFCNKCHFSFHLKHGFRRNTRAQLNEYLRKHTAI